MRLFGPIVSALAVLAGVAAQAQQGPSLDEIRQALVPYASAKDVVTLPDGREVGFTCMGEGSPTVILIPGMGDFGGIAWAGVHPQMAETTRVCAWDRPGWGLSDGAQGRHTIASNVATLEAALATGKIPGPYVVVGHSLGGLEAADQDVVDRCGGPRRQPPSEPAHQQMKSKRHEDDRQDDDQAP